MKRNNTQNPKSSASRKILKQVYQLRSFAGNIISAKLLSIIRLWNVIVGEEIRTLIGHTEAVFSVAVSPDGYMIASGSYDGTVRFWGIPITGN